ncbi:MAG: hypothetical protein R3C68_05200 [Myxococcota bacterium]
MKNYTPGVFAQRADDPEVEEAVHTFDMSSTVALTNKSNRYRDVDLQFYVGHFPEGLVGALPKINTIALPDASNAGKTVAAKVIASQYDDTAKILTATVRVPPTETQVGAKETPAMVTAHFTVNVTEARVIAK